MALEISQGSEAKVAAMEDKCRGGMAGDRLVVPSDGRHHFGRPIYVKSTQQRELVCSFCGIHAPVPANAEKREPPVGSRNTLRLTKIKDFQTPPQNLRRNVITLKEKQAQLASLRLRALTREEAIRFGYPQEEIDYAWPPTEPAKTSPTKPSP